jgi:hypothetical protein
MGKEGHGVMNENGERLANMSSTNGLVIGGTLFVQSLFIMIATPSVCWLSSLPEYMMV